MSGRVPRTRFASERHLILLNITNFKHKGRVRVLYGALRGVCSHCCIDYPFVVSPNRTYTRLCFFWVFLNLFKKTKSFGLKTFCGCIKLTDDSWSPATCRPDTRGEQVSCCAHLSLSVSIPAIPYSSLLGQ